MEYEENRWLQRFQNYQRILYRLDEELKEDVNEMSELEKSGLIKRFEMIYELGWNTMKDYLTEQGEIMVGSVQAIRSAFKAGIIDDGNLWMQMKNSRDLAAHTYDESFADELAEKIANEYYEAFDLFDKKMTAIKNALDA